MLHANRTRWRGSQRVRLMRVANELKGTLAILSPFKGRAEPVGAPLEVREARLNPGIMDVAFAGEPIMCDPATCAYLQRVFPWRRRQNASEAGDYKYVIDVSQSRSSIRLLHMLNFLFLEGGRKRLVRALQGPHHIQRPRVQGDDLS